MVGLDIGRVAIQLRRLCAILCFGGLVGCTNSDIRSVPFSPADVTPDGDATSTDGDLGVDGSDIDTRPDCDPTTDTDGDGLDDCDEAALCTNPGESDTDNDGLSDYEEVELGYDPCDPDMDDDGVEDGREHEVGLDPNDPTTNDQKGPDSQRWVARACDEISPESTFFRTDTTANWKRGLGSRFDNFSRVRTSAGGTLPSAIFSDSQSGLFGYMLTLPVQSTTIPGAVLEEQVRSALESFGNLQDPLLAGGSFETHDSREAARQEWIYTAQPPLSAAKLRNRLVEWPFSQPLGDLREPVGFEKSQFRIRATAVRRQNEEGGDRAIVMVGLVPGDQVESQGRGPALKALEGMVSHTTVAGAEAEVRTICETAIVESQNPGDTHIYFVVDTKEMVPAYKQRVETFVGELDVLSDRVTSIKLGVTNMALANKGRIAGGTWTRDTSELLTRLTDTVFGCPAQSGWACPGEATGLEAARQGLSYYLGLGDESPPPSEAIGPDDQVVTIFIADEDDRSSDSVDSYSSFFAGRTKLRGFVSQEASTSDQMWCEQSDPASRYGTVVENVSTMTNSLCRSSRLNAQRVFNQAVPREQFSGPDVPNFPIDPSMHVTVEGESLTETEVGDGFWLANNSSLQFSGIYRGKVWSGEVPTDVAWTYQVFDPEESGGLGE